MTQAEPRSILSGHEVMNQPGQRGDIDLWADDPALRSRVPGDEPDLPRLGAALGSQEMREAGRIANRNLPELRLFDRSGRRLDEVVFHPAYHQLMRLGLESGYAARPWEERPGGHLAHAAMIYMFSQVEPGVCCPMTMTYAATPALAADPALSAKWRPGLTARAYDPGLRPVGQKAGVTMGMAMTEKQGGSDVRANSTIAERDGAGYRLTGHKWFCSAPMSDAFLTLAQAPEGLTCFLVPRWLEDGSRNTIHIMRLKDKLGNKANASSEIEYHATFAQRLGDEGAGVRTIIEMVHHTRLDTAMAPAGLMRAALSEALWWCEGRSTFQRRLIDQPLMRSVLADLALDWEGALALGLHVARAFDGTHPEDRAIARIGVALAKFLSNKLCPNLVYEAMECLGGMGYVEETPLPMLYREAPLNSIWEGSGNVICLDILRSLGRDARTAEVLDTELDAASGVDARYDAALAEHRARWPRPAAEAEARFFAERLAVLLTASVLIREGAGALADAYVATRVTGARGHVAGSIAGVDTAAILARLAPH